MSRSTSIRCEGLAISEYPYAGNGPILTIVFEDRADRSLRQRDRRREHVQVMVQRPRQPKFPFAEVVLESFEVRLRDVLELSLDPGCHLPSAAGLNNTEGRCRTHLTRSLTHSISRNSSRRSSSTWMSTRFSTGAISGYTRPTVRNALASHRRSVAANRRHSVDSAAIRLRNCAAMSTTYAELGRRRKGGPRRCRRARRTLAHRVRRAGRAPARRWR